jgi:probable rRNA maturation factor
VPLTILKRARKVPLAVTSLRPALESALAAAGVADREVTLVLVSDRAIHRLNREWRHVDAPTDCLSFPAGEGEDGQFAGEVLGDIVISVDTALAQGCEHVPEGTAPEDALAEEVVFLFVHSLLHLLGYDHHEPEDGEAMRAREREILGTISRTRPPASPG